MRLQMSQERMEIRKWPLPGQYPLAMVEPRLTITPRITAPMVRIIRPLVLHFPARVAL